MKKIILLCCLLSGFILAFTSGRRDTPESGIRGSVDPADGAVKVWAIRAADSVSTIILSGKFSFTLRPGNWNLRVEAVRPYRDAYRDNILVLDNQFTETGVISLGK